MSWSSTRSTAGTVVRERAHSDDAKHRTHDAHHASQPRFPRWTLPVAAGVAVVVVIGGTTAVLASHRGAPARHSATPRQQAGASGDQDGPADPTTATSPSPAGLAGRSFTITGTWRVVSAPFNGYPGSTRDYPGTTFRVACATNSCLVSGKFTSTERFTAVGQGTYRVTFQRTESMPGGTVHYPVKATLTVTGARATLVYRHPGRILGISTLHPATLTLSGPIHFTD